LQKKTARNKRKEEARSIKMSLENSNDQTLLESGSSVENAKTEKPLEAKPVKTKPAPKRILKTLDDVATQVFEKNVWRIKNSPKLLWRQGEFKSDEHTFRQTTGNWLYYETADKNGNVEVHDAFRKIAASEPINDYWPVLDENVDFEARPGAIIKRRMWNLFKGFPPLPRNTYTDVSNWKELLLSLADGDEHNAHWLECWLADILKNPNEKPGTAVVIRSKNKGVGKGTLGDVMKLLLGQEQVSVWSSDPFTRNFNGGLETALLLIMNEGSFDKKSATTGALKHYITDETFRYEQKFEAAKELRNCGRILMTSNEEWLVRTDQQERRWFVLDTAKKPSDEFFDKIREDMKNRSWLGAVRDRLVGLTIDVNLRRAPITQAAQDQIDLSGDYVDLLLDDLWEDEDEYKEQNVILDTPSTYRPGLCIKLSKACEVFERLNHKAIGAKALAKRLREKDITLFEGYNKKLFVDLTDYFQSRIVKKPLEATNETKDEKEVTENSGLFA
jgi:hypothetical protein